MSEKIYAWLLRLFPSHFREAYGDAALQLFRDRARDEKGWVAGMRLWLDLLADLAISVPREYRNVRPALVGNSATQQLDGVPSFNVLRGEPPRFEALFFGSVLSLAALGAFSVLISHVGTYRHDAGASGSPSSSLPLLQRQALRAEPQAATGAMIGAVVEDAKLDAAERQRVIDAAIANLKKYYAYPDVGRKMSDALLALHNGGDDRAITDGAAFADLLTRHMRDVSHDMHLVMVYSQAKLPELREEPTPEDARRYRNAMEQSNCTFERVEILPHNIGYLKLNSFPDLAVCKGAAVAAMATLNHADAIIFDLRDNTGGSPSTVSLIASYLFDHPEYMYNPRESPTLQSWTTSPVPGNRLTDKPAYVLTSSSTFSGAEQFSYDLKMLKRVTLVGETTGGGAHAGVFHRIDDHFGMGIPEAKAINPFSKTDWEGTGVEPDVKVKAADALDTAEKLAEKKLQKK